MEELGLACIMQSKLQEQTALGGLCIFCCVERFTLDEVVSSEMSVTGLWPVMAAAFASF